MFFSQMTETITAVLTALAAHWGYFVHGELDLQAASIARVHFLAALLLPCLKYQVQALSMTEAVWKSFILDTVYMITLFTSIIIYRVFVSPLRNVPGPLAMRISKLVHVWDNVDSTRPNFKMLHKLREQYGDVVRTGECVLSVPGQTDNLTQHATRSE